MGNANLKIFVMVNDPSQTSAVAMQALNNIGGKMQVIRARMPDLNPIENLFHIVGKKIEAEILEKNITYPVFPHANFKNPLSRLKNSIFITKITHKNC